MAMRRKIVLGPTLFAARLFQLAAEDSMPPPTPSTPLSGSFQIFRVAGISVFIHWTWILVAMYQVQARAPLYASPFWNMAEYLSVFAIVLLHEFGHAFACRQVGGKAGASFFGRWEASLSSIRQPGQAPSFGALPPARWSTWCFCP